MGEGTVDSAGGQYFRGEGHRLTREVWQHHRNLRLCEGDSHPRFTPRRVIDLAPGPSRNTPVSPIVWARNRDIDFIYSLVVIGR